MHRPGPLLLAILAVIALQPVGTRPAVGAESDRRALPSATGEYMLRRWTSDDGLPQNSVIAITQTDDGYLWLATFGGLVRFDGVRFEVFDPDRVPEIGEYHRHLSPDRDNGLWISGTGGDLRVTYHRDGSFRRLTAEDGLPEGKASRVAVGPDGTVYAGLEDGRLLRREQGRFLPLAPSPRPDWGNLSQIRFDHAGRIWTESKRRFCWWERGSWHEMPSPPEGLDPSCFVPQPDGSILFAGNTPVRQLLRWDGSRLGPFDTCPDGIPGMSHYRRDRSGDLWVVQDGPPLRRDPDGRWSEVGRGTPLAAGPQRVSFEDREGNLWVGTDGAGLFRLRRRSVRTAGVPEGLPRPVVLSVAEAADHSILVAAHASGVHRLVQGRFEPLRRLPRLHAGLLAWCVWPRRDGGMWVGTFGEGLFDVPPGAAAVTVTDGKTTPGALAGNHRALLEDSRGHLWAGGQQGLARYAAGTHRLWTRTNGLPDDLVTSIAEAEGGAVWVGGNRGLTRVDDAGTRTYTQADGLAHERVRALFAGKDGTLWIGGGGLTRLRGGRFTAIRAEHGLPVETIKSIVADDVGGLWWGTPHGVFHATQADLDDFCEGRRSRVEPRRFDREDGMPSNECSGYQPGAWKAADGRLWFATLDGLALIDPARLPRNALPPRLIVESVVADGRVLDPRSGTVRLPAGTLVAEFRYTATSLAAAERNRFRCHLRGFEDQPREVGNSRAAVFTRFGPGRYTFHVTGCNNDGVWSEAGAAVEVVVAPFFWQTLAFRVVTGSAVLAALAAAIRWVSQRHLRRQVAELERAQAVNRERARIARNMHDDVGASLTQISLLSELARRQLQDPAAAQARLAELGDISRDVVRNLDALVWAVDPGHDTVVGLVEYLGSFAQEFLQPTGIACRLDLPADLPATPLAAATRHHVLMMMKEALNNVVKHAAATQVTFRVRPAEHRLTLELEDDGRGFDPSSAGRFSDGLVNLRERARQAGGRCEILSRPGAGTRVVLELNLTG